MPDPLVDFQKKVIRLTDAQLRLITDYNIRAQSIARNRSAVQDLVSHVKTTIRENNYGYREKTEITSLIRRIRAEIDISIRSLALEESLGTSEFEPLKQEESADQSALRMLETSIVAITKTARQLPDTEAKAQLLQFLSRVREEKNILERELQINTYLEALLGNLVHIVLEEHALLRDERDSLENFDFDDLTEDRKAILADINQALLEIVSTLVTLVEKEKKVFIDPFKAFTDQKYDVNKRILELAQQPVITKEAIKRDLRSLSPTQAEEYLRLLDRELYRVGPPKVIGEIQQFAERFGSFFRAKKALQEIRVEEELRGKLALAQRRAAVDTLTNVFSRGFFEETYPLKIREGARRGWVSIFLFDIDKFKNFNDTYGHDVGDWVLSKVGTIAKESLRSGDMIFRYGGEEFIVIFNAGTDPEGAVQTADRLRRTLEVKSEEEIHGSDDPLLERLRGDRGRITISGGVATIFIHKPTLDSQDVQGIGDLLKGTADKKLYEAKGSGRNRVLAASIDYLPVD